MRRKLSKSRANIKAEVGYPHRREIGLGDSDLEGAKNRGISKWENVGEVAGWHVGFVKVRKEGMASGG